MVGSRDNGGNKSSSAAGLLCCMEPKSTSRMLVPGAIDDERGEYGSARCVKNIAVPGNRKHQDL